MRAWRLICNKKQWFLLRKLPCNWEVRGHCMCKEMTAIPVNRVVDKKKIIKKNNANEN
jgi:tetrahydromethanopterin S-methyltransferase subunit A